MSKRPTTTTAHTMVEPDLIVILGMGEEEEIVIAYGQILARDSDYVHAKLSHWKQRRRNEPIMIRFPDTTRGVWDKAMRYLEPGQALDFLECGACFNEQTMQHDMCEILPFYHQYSFRAGVDMCDRIIAHVLEDDERIQQQHVINGIYDGGYDQGIRQAAALALKYKLPRSFEAAKALTSVFFEIAPEINLDRDNVTCFLACLSIDHDEALLRINAGKVLCLRYENGDYRTFDITPDALKDYVTAGQQLTRKQLEQLVSEQSFASEVCSYLIGNSQSKG